MSPAPKGTPSLTRCTALLSYVAPLLPVVFHAMPCHASHPGFFPARLTHLIGNRKRCSAHSFFPYYSLHPCVHALPCTLESGLLCPSGFPPGGPRRRCSACCLFCWNLTPRLLAGHAFPTAIAAQPQRSAAHPAALCCPHHPPLNVIRRSDLFHSSTSLLTPSTHCAVPCLLASPIVPLHAVCASMSTVVFDRCRSDPLLVPSCLLNC